ncbi:glycosyl transferase [Mycolicibacterium sp. (ex Dasyatis americana)]|uniref:Glycosyl transferase n=1 Tax=Mycobacterium syngnathidarum TaxID=1908205 RepID=A0A1S1K1R7_9MYCO|nr:MULTISPECIES: glycosyltransferase [Mycobacterium]OFB35789.1 glycosyl transferase [Mycolicibacterium sp. (ex Dasyatis americana)]MCG7609083.1 glycosyltransferase [Mycobacterium sp. CnD-18-1]OHT96474.1 glycosyl transferase [Mycobacterium syngnathidarum]OLT93337.1 glycosyl transferase [Mycobacterium syngnathidarum]TMS55513.1 glycosyltransferase [Mycobacterium sp. DBP42]
MKFVLAFYGTRGDVEPGVAVGRELLRRGHEVRMAVSPDLVEFVEAAGPAAIPCGPDVRVWQDLNRDFWARFLRKFWKNFWRVRDLAGLLREEWHLFDQYWQEVSKTLMSLADGADLLFTGVIGEEAAGNVAEALDIPFAMLHVFPLRPNGQLVPSLPPRLARAMMRASEWLSWPMMKRLEDPQRRELGLPKASGPSAWRVAERGSLEIQAYDEIYFPGLAAEWSEWDGQRPFVGALTMELPTDTDDEIASWIAAGSPPICFGFGSMPVDSAADTLEMVSAATAELGERALICAGASDFSGVAHPDHVKVVNTMNYSAAFPACRAVVHHGGAGTTAAGLRAGVPTLVLSTDLDQTLWGARIKRLKVGTTRRLSATTRKSLVSDLRTILEPQFAARAREVAVQMTNPAESVAATADLLEKFAHLRRVG